MEWMIGQAGALWDITTRRAQFLGAIGKVERAQKLVICG